MRDAQKTDKWLKNGAPVFHFKPTPSSGLMRQHFLIMKFTLRTILLSTICLAWSHMLLAQTFSKNDFTYTVTSANEVTITSGPNPDDGTVTIPATVTNDGTTYNVTEIGDISFFNRDKIKTVFIPSSVSRIGNSAFWGCNALTSITISEGVTVIDHGAFCYTGSDKSKAGVISITIPSSVTKIGDWAFKNQGNLETINITNNIAVEIGVGAFEGTKWYDNKADGMVYANNVVAYHFKGNGTTATINTGTVRLANYAFEGCTALTSVTIPSTVTHIGEFAFRGCTSLTSINIPTSVTSIGNSAFSHCAALTAVTLPSSLSIINHNLFFACTSLTNVSIPSSVTEIRSYAFKDCTALNLSVPSGVKTIGVEAFSKVPSVSYSGSATGSPWGADSVH